MGDGHQATISEVPGAGREYIYRGVIEGLKNVNLKWVRKKKKKTREKDRIGFQNGIVCYDNMKYMKGD